MEKRRVVVLGMFALGLGYFLWYTPYSALGKGISGALLPGIDEPVGGLVLLPATVIGQLIAMPVFVIASGWWRYSRRRRVRGRDLLIPARITAESAFWMAIIVGTTTLNFTFQGASIVLMLVLMRIGTLIIAPTWDLLRGRKIPWYCQGALALCMVSAVIALTDINNYKLTAGAIMSLVGYCVAYYLRFRLMSAHAKTGDIALDRRYFIEEHMATPIVLLIIVGIPALIDQGTWPHALHLGFTSFLSTPAVFPALMIGVCYEGLFIMTTLIFLDRRGFSFGMPVHVTSSLLAGVVASLSLHGLYGAVLPSAAQYIAASAVIGAAFLLSYPTIKAFRSRRSGRPQVARKLILFVCGGNTGRSPMAAAIARAELAAVNAAVDAAAAGNGTRNGRGHARPQVNELVRWEVDSAGVSVRDRRAPITPEASDALRDLGIDAPLDHRSKQLTAAMCVDTEVVYCMTREQRDSVLVIAPGAAGRTVCLDPGDDDVADPAGQPVDAYRTTAIRLRTLVRGRLEEQRDRYAVPAAEGAVPAAGEAVPDGT
jgi:protein-tyrosine-phosphatase